MRLIISQKNAVDRLTSALYGSAQTQINYDIAGHKLTLDDPDMGLWSYAYDALPFQGAARGNLTRQMDARGQRIVNPSTRKQQHSGRGSSTRYLIP